MAGGDGGSGGHRYVLSGPTPIARYPVKSAKKAPPIGSVRAKIAYLLILIFAGTIAASFIGLALHWANVADLRDFVTPFITAEVGVLGAVTGFYFATHEHDTSNEHTHKDREDGEDSG